MKSTWYICHTSIYISVVLIKKKCLMPRKNRNRNRSNSLVSQLSALSFINLSRRISRRFSKFKSKLSTKSFFSSEYEPTLPKGQKIPLPYDISEKPKPETPKNSPVMTAILTALNPNDPFTKQKKLDSEKKKNEISAWAKYLGKFKDFEPPLPKRESPVEAFKAPSGHHLFPKVPRR